MSRRDSRIRQPERARIWFEPPSFEAIRSGFHSASRLRTNAPKFREVSADEPEAPAAVASERSQYGGASCRKATSHRSPASAAANSSRSTRLTARCSVESFGGRSRPW